MAIKNFPMTPMATRIQKYPKRNKEFTVDFNWKEKKLKFRIFFTAQII